MSIYTHKNKEVLNRIVRIDITDYIQQFLIERKKIELFTPKIANLEQVSYIREELNRAENTTFKSFKDLHGLYYWNVQKVDFVPSNLGEDRGFLFYFVCNGCERQVKYLYEYSSCESPLCRHCCHLKYRKKVIKKSLQIVLG